MTAMEVFHCARCDTVLSRTLRRVPYPHRDTTPPQHFSGPARMEPGTYAVDPEPFGPPWLPAGGGSDGPCGTYVLAPGDARNTRLVLDRCASGCLGLNGGLGPNAACGSCGAAVATRIDDCDHWQEVRLEPAAVAVREVPGDGAEPPDPFRWESAENARLGTGPGDEDDWLWYGTLAACAARILARSGGAPIFLVEGPGDPIRTILTAVLKHTSRAGAVRRLPAPQTAAWRVAAAAAGLDDTRPIAICDFAGPDRPFGAIPIAPEGVRFIGVVPARDGSPAWAPGRPVRGVPLDAGIWSYLVQDQTRTVRSLARTHWRHRIADHEEPAPISAAPSRCLFDFTRCLRHQPEAAEPWLRDLIGELPRW
jgi:hypothetical protein